MFGLPYIVTAPVCRRCGWRIQGRRILSVVITIIAVILVAMYLWPMVSDHVPRASRRWVGFAMTIVCLTPLLCYEMFSPPPLGLTAFARSVDYEFRDVKAAYVFAEMNKNAEWVKVDGEPYESHEEIVLAVDLDRRSKKRPLPDGSTIAWVEVTPAEFDTSMKWDATTAEFSTDRTEEIYVDNDSELIEIIKRTCREVLGDVADEHTYHLYDWWPNHTRYVTLSKDVCSLQLIVKLRSCLTGTFKDYRIQILVVDDLPNDDHEAIGSLAINSNRVVIENAAAAAISKVD